MGKKIKLENLRVTSFVTEVRKKEQDRAKAGTGGDMSTWQFVCMSYPDGPTCDCPQTGSCGCGGDPFTTNYPSNPAQIICV